MESLALLLAKQSPRERAGSRTSNRITFQHDWTLCKVLELHETAAPYAVLCDYHEDVLVLDDEANPTEALPIQIKTGRHSPWTLSALLQLDKEKGVKKGAKKSGKNSHLGKLYLGCSAFSQSVPELRFVTTSAFKLKLNSEPSSTERTHFTLADLEDSVSEQIAEKLQAELGLSDRHPLLPSITFEVTELSLKGHPVHTKGKLTEFLEKLYPGAPIPAAAAYQAISGEISRITSCEEPFSVLSEMISKKGLSRSKFEKILSQLPIVRDPSSIWQAAQARITQEAPFPVEAAIRRAWKQYEADRMDFSNQLLQDTRSRVKAEMLTQALLPTNDTLLQAASSAVAKDLDTLGQPLEYMQAMAILEYYEHELSPVNPQS